MLYIKTNDALRALKQLKRNLSKSEINKAVARAINRSLAKVRTQARREVRQVYNIASKDTKGINYNRANVRTLTGELYAETKPIPLDAFAPKQETGQRSIRVTKRGEQRVREFRRVKKNPTAGVSIEVLRGQREIVPYAFMIPGAKARVFARGSYKQGTSKGFVQRHQRVNSKGSDTPIKPLITVSVFATVINKKVIKHLEEQARQFYPQRLVHELKFIAGEID